MDVGEQHFYAFKSLGIKCHNRLEIPFIGGVGAVSTVQGHPTKGSYIYQLPPDAVYHPHLRTTPTVELSHQTAPSWQRGGGRMGEMRGGQNQTREKGKRERKRERQDESGLGRPFLIC